MGTVRRHLLHVLYGTDPDLGAAEGCWHPPADVYRHERGWVVKFDLAGVDPRDVQIEVGGSLLTVHGVRRDLTLVEGCHVFSMEIAYNRFRRSIELPCDLEASQIHHEYRDGMLLVSCLTEPTSR